MSVVALEALLLRSLIERHGVTADLGNRVRRALAAAIVRPWLMATSEDYRYPGTTGPARTRAVALRHWLTDVIAGAARLDAKVHYRWLRVVNLVDAPVRLLHPALLARTAIAHLRPGPALQRHTVMPD